MDVWYSADTHEWIAAQSAWQSATDEPDGRVLILISLRPAQPVCPPDTVVNVGGGLTSFIMSVMDDDVEPALLAMALLKHVVESSHLLDDAV